VSDARAETDPVEAFCTELRHLTRRSSLSASAASRRLHISRSQYYAIINGEVRRPPDWAKVEVILRLCGEVDGTVAAWRQRHDRMVLEYDELRTRRRSGGPATAPDERPLSDPGHGTGNEPGENAPAAETAADAPAGDARAEETATDAGAAEGGSGTAEGGGRGRGLRWRRVITLAVVLALAAAAVVLGIRIHGRDGSGGKSSAAVKPGGVLPSLAADGTLSGPLAGATPEPPNPADPNERAACISAAPPAGTELLTVPKQHRPGNNKMNHDWWGSGGQISFNAANPAAFDANVAPGTGDMWNVIVLHSCIPLVANHKYELRYSAASSPAGPVMVRVQDSVDPEHNASYTRILDYAPVPRAEKIEFTAQQTSRSSEVTFQVGGRVEAFRLRVTGLSLTERSG
jgi:hypothetical protein